MVPWTDARCALGQPRPCWPEPRAEVYPATPAGAGTFAACSSFATSGRGGTSKRKSFEKLSLGVRLAVCKQLPRALAVRSADRPAAYSPPSARCPPWRQPEVRRRRRRRLGCAAPAGRSLGRPRLGFRCRADELSVPLLELRAEERARPAAARRRLPAPLACAKMKRFDLCLSGFPPALHACKGHQNFLTA